MDLCLKWQQGEHLVEILDSLEDLGEKVPEEEWLLLCRFCRHRITSADQAIRINDRHLHTCTNPAGITFRIGCYASAAGCLHQGIPTSEFTWFAGFAWQIALCANCLIQMGWHFQAGDERQFHGLIQNHLIEGD